MVDLMPYIHSVIESSGVNDGTVTVISRHTTTAITINEWEQRLARDLRTWLLQLAPPDDRSTIGKSAGIRYEHNDIDQRPESDDERQRAQANEFSNPMPTNSHSHRKPECQRLAYHLEQISPSLFSFVRVLCRLQGASRMDGMWMNRTCCSVGAIRSPSMRIRIWPLCCSAAARPSPSVAAALCSGSGSPSCWSMSTAHESAGSVSSAWGSSEHLKHIWVRSSLLFSQPTPGATNRNRAGAVPLGVMLR